MKYRDLLDHIYSDLMKQYEPNENLADALELIDDLQNKIDDLTLKN